MAAGLYRHEYHTKSSICVGKDTIDLGKKKSWNFHKPVFSEGKFLGQNRISRWNCSVLTGLKEVVSRYFKLFFLEVDPIDSGQKGEPNLHPWKTNMTMEKQPFEDVPPHPPHPQKKGVFSIVMLVFEGVIGWETWIIRAFWRRFPLESAPFGGDQSVWGATVHRLSAVACPTPPPPNLPFDFACGWV